MTEKIFLYRALNQTISEGSAVLMQTEIAVNEKLSQITPVPFTARQSCSARFNRATG